MGAFEKCANVNEVLDLLKEMRNAGTLTITQELVAELRLIELQSANILPTDPSVNHNNDSDSDTNDIIPLPSTSTDDTEHVSHYAFICLLSEAQMVSL